MTSRGTPRFWAGVPRAARRSPGRRAEGYGLFRENPQHPGLQLKKVHDRDPVYSVRVSLGYRAVGLIENDEITWFWIGSHADYDRLLKNL